MQPHSSIAYVLRAKAYRESSLLLDLFTEACGKISCVARGVKRSKSPWRGLLQAFTPLEIAWQGRHSLQTVVDANLAAPAHSLNGLAQLSGQYVNELLLRLMMAQDPNPEIFQSYGYTLAGLAQGQIHASLRQFEKHLLQHMGFAPLLTRDYQSGSAIAAEHYYRFDPQQGPTIIHATSHRGLIAGKTLLAIDANDFTDPTVCKQARMVLQSALRQLLGEKPLQTQRVMAQLHKKLRLQGLQDFLYFT